MYSSPPPPKQNKQTHTPLLHTRRSLWGLPLTLHPCMPRTALREPLLRTARLCTACGNSVALGHLDILGPDYEKSRAFLWAKGAAEFAHVTSGRATFGRVGFAALVVAGVACCALFVRRLRRERRREQRWKSDWDLDL